MDGTAVGFLKKLQKYERDEFQLPKFHNKKCIGLLFRTKSVREVVDNIWISSTNFRNNFFDVPLFHKASKGNPVRFLFGDGTKQKNDDKADFELLHESNFTCLFL